MTVDDPREFYSHLRVGHNRSAKYSASDGRTPSNTADCTHWCMPGIPDVVAGKLMAAMLSADLSPYVLQ